MAKYIITCQGGRHEVDLDAESAEGIIKKAEEFLVKKYEGWYKSDILYELYKVDGGKLVHRGSVYG